MVIPYRDVHVEWWDSHFLSIDYGFGKSSAVAHLHVRTQDGRIITIGEFVAKHMPAYQFAEEMARCLIAPTLNGLRRRIEAVYLDPANFKNLGDGHAISNQINDVLDDYDLGVRAASNDRVGGWQLMFKMLQTGEYQIADTCPRLIEAIPSRMHDDKRSGDVLKVSGDPLDDVADSARYGIYSFITTAEKPKELIIRETLAPLAAQGDLTSCQIRFLQMTEDPQPNFRPATLGRYSHWRWRRR
jgi:hypothetical protein